MSDTTLSRARVSTAVRTVAGLAELTGHLGSEITRVVQEVHAASTPTSRLGVDFVGRAVYGGIRVGFLGARRAAALGGRLAGREPVPDRLLDVQSALNGAFGHLYEEAGSAFALPMRLVRRGAGGQAPPGRQVVFVHGLCMNERGWRGRAHAGFRAWASRRLGAGTVYVRYNTGLRISTNGARLAELLERELGESEIVLVGHSMGGLVARSALHQAREAGHRWGRRVSHLACVGSPHEGASLERLGNHANRLLAVSPWTRPFMRLGNLRSDGIRDLRFGDLVEADWRDRSPDDPRRRHTRVGLAGDVAHLHVAGTRGRRRAAAPSGDGLVHVDSALARHLHAEQGVRRELLEGVGHIALLGDRRVYELLRRWLEARG